MTNLTDSTATKRLTAEAESGDDEGEAEKSASVRGRDRDRERGRDRFERASVRDRGTRQRSPHGDADERERRRGRRAHCAWRPAARDRGRRWQPRKRRPSRAAAPASRAPRRRRRESRRPPDARKTKKHEGRRERSCRPFLLPDSLGRYRHETVTLSHDASRPRPSSHPVGGPCLSAQRDLSHDLEDFSLCRRRGDDALSFRRWPMRAACARSAARPSIRSPRPWPSESLAPIPKLGSPIVESTGTGAGFKLFCAGVGERFPDISNASRRMKASEAKQCAANGVKESPKSRSASTASRWRPPRAPASPASPSATSISRSPRRRSASRNKAKTWKDVNGKLPAIPIRVYGPPPTSGTRDSLNELMMTPAAKPTRRWPR